jgi:hypothetical protein
MKKPSLYFETSVISAFWYEGSNISMQARRLRTREWWDMERVHFDLVSSAFTEMELRAGVFRRQAECLSMVRRFRFVALSSGFADLVHAIVDRGIVPQNKEADAAHLAISTTHDVDFLLTWNYAHMANPVVQAQLQDLCEQLELDAPLMVSPETIPRVGLGQSIRRKR